MPHGTRHANVPAGRGPIVPRGRIKSRPPGGETKIGYAPARIVIGGHPCAGASRAAHHRPLPAPKHAAGMQENA
jgi:hypothetical protein